VGLILLLAIALRALVLTQFVAWENLKERGQKMSGFYAGQPGRQTDRPHANREYVVRLDT
jgi:hypothetical protein